MNLAYLLDRHAEDRPDAPALIRADGVALSWSETRDRVDRLAGQLIDRGVRVGDRVGLLSANRPEFLLAVLATARIGAIVVPQNYRLAAPELRYQCEDAGLSLWLVDPDHADLASATEAEVFREDLVALAARDGAPIKKAAAVRPDDLFGIFYTGGTTGLAKGVMLTHGNLLTNANHLLPLLHFTPDDVHMHAAPMFHLADFGGTVGNLLGGGAHCFQAAFDPGALCGLIERHRVTTMVLAPTMLDLLARDPAVADHDLGSLRQVLYGGSPITETALRRVLEVLPNAEIIQGFGQTEATQTVTLLSAEDHRRAAAGDAGLLRSCGRPIPGVHLRIVDEADQPVAPGEIGELAMRAPTVMAGYWNKPEETAAALRGDWLHMGDLGYRDADGFVYLVDRKKDMIVTGAENVFSTEVENALAAHPDVVDVAVIGVPDAQFGERVHAVIVPRPGADLDIDSLRAFARERIAGYKLPKSADFVEVLPKTATGKVQKRDLRAPYWAGQGRDIA